MSDDEIRTTIAKACGYHDVRYDYANGHDTFKSWLGEHPRYCGGPPDYANSLEAMHQAEKILNDAQCRAYNEALCKACVPLASLFPPFPERRCETYLFHATARQRAEAFVKTIAEPTP